ncbi:CoA transferase [Streptomyces sp. NRRL F-5630]|uniref:CoA transferase n=1 Tax=Streptomyces sp. NRRL F-5630 TaxID=1463864 RepID=UPI003D764F52
MTSTSSTSQTMNAHRAATDLTRLLSPLRLPRSTVGIVGADPLVPSVHRLGEASAAAIAAFGHQLAGLLEDGGAAPQQVSVSVEQAIDQLRAAYLGTTNGVPTARIAEDPSALGNNDFYRARDDRWIFLITTYPRQRDAVCTVLNVPPVKDRIAEAVAHWDAFALEDAVCDAGGVCAVVRTADEWRSHPAGRHLLGRAVVQVERIADADPVPLPAAGPGGPLHGLRVLDNTHVIAGPVSTQLLSTFGADTLHLSRPDLPDPIAMAILTGGGKRNAFCDLRDPGQAARVKDLAAQADVYVDSYRGMAARGFGAEDVARMRPGIVAVQYHCWGADGPWGQRGGFDQLACAATGFSYEEWTDRPSLPPTHLLNDYLAAYLGAAATVAALRRRAVEGGSWRVRVDLAQVCMWVQDLGQFPRSDVAGLPRPTTSSIPVVTTEGPFGTVVQPGLPLRFSGMPTPAPGPARPLGADTLDWQERR